MAKRSGSLDRALLLIIGSIIVVGGGYIALKRSESSLPEPRLMPARAIDATDHIRGSLDAPIQMIVYSDLECPYCKRFHFDMLPILKAEYPDVVLAFRHYPMPSRPKAYPEALAAECVAQTANEETFWRFLDILFMSTPSDNGLELSRLPQLAQDSGADLARYESCMALKSSEAKVHADMRDGARASVALVPTFVFMKGDESVVVSGYRREKIRAAIETMRKLDE